MSGFSHKIVIGKDSKDPLTVNRLGYGTMRLTGKRIWGKPKDYENAIQILQTAASNGIEYFDTADFYGPAVTNQLLANALFPYPENLVIGTKIGVVRKEDKSWNAFNKAGELRRSVENNLEQLKLDTLSLVHFRIMPDAKTPFEDSLEVMFRMQEEGLIKHIGLSNVSRKQLDFALDRGKIASVQNLYGYIKRKGMDDQHTNSGGEQVLDLCEKKEIPLIPYYSLETSLPEEQVRMQEMAKKYDLTLAQMNICWLMNKSSQILPIPGTTSLEHLKQNIAAAQIKLSEKEMQILG